MRRAPDRSARAPRRGERGTATVELAIILPVLTLFVLTIADLGLVLREFQVVQNAAREGARYSIHPPNWIDPRNPNASDGPIKQHVIDYLQQEGIPLDATSVTVTQSEPIVVGGLTLDGSRITVTYTRTLLIPGAGLLLPNDLTLSGTAVFRNLY